jgi:hypothetical protein
VSYTLPKPGQDYDAVFHVLWSCAVQYAHVDESEVLVRTEFSSAAIERLLSAVVDFNDSFRIFTVSNVRTWNSNICWNAGAQAIPASRLRAREYLRQLLIVAHSLKRAS